MIRRLEGESPVFVLDTKNTTYAFAVMETGQLEHLCYGKKIHLTDAAQAYGMREKFIGAPGNSTAYDQEHLAWSLEDVMLETSGVGKGDIREPMVELTAPDGSATTDFVFTSFDITHGKQPFDTLPGSYDESGEVAELTIAMRDRNHGYVLELHYWTYDDCDVITRSAKLINASDGDVTVDRLLSYTLDLCEADLTVSTFHGGWAKEMTRRDVVLTGGKFTNDTRIGASSSRSNPFFMVSRAGCGENHGDVFGFNLIYSGNHAEIAEVSSHRKTRITAGINPAGFAWHLAAGESLEAPEAVMTFSPDGFNGMSQHMHDFVREHIVRGEWAKKDRPVLLNSWEASYFNISESSLMKLAKAGKDAGIELFVMDDGWFGTRSDDRQALGDWDVNRKKLPNGLDGLAKKINALGLMFGLWVEPEMINVNSDLYRAHPDWAMAIPGMNHSEGRNQRVLDLANPEVADYMTKKMAEVFSSANISYVKWDMNRIFSDVYSPYLPADRQKETAHRYMLGLYRMMESLTEQFPHILFEGCASGGNRFDLGILSCFPQIWASDDTDAICRLSIQTGLSYGYPLNTYTGHVSVCPNHQTYRTTPLHTRFAVAAFSSFGYECNLAEMGKDELEEIREQIEIYKKYRHTIQQGRFFRGSVWGNEWEWTAVSRDQKQAVGMICQKEQLPQNLTHIFTPMGLRDEWLYHFTSRANSVDVRAFGSLINMIAPMHVKQDGLAHSVIAKFLKLQTEKEDFTSYGDTLMNAGVKISPYVGMDGQEMKLSYFPDFDSRLCFMDEEET